MESFHYDMLAPRLIWLRAWFLALGCAVLSWHAFEKPAMSLHRRVPPDTAELRKGPVVA